MNVTIKNSVFVHNIMYKLNHNDFDKIIDKIKSIDNLCITKVIYDGFNMPSEGDLIVIKFDNGIVYISFIIKQVAKAITADWNFGLNEYSIHPIGIGIYKLSTLFDIIDNLENSLKPKSLSEIKDIFDKYEKL